MRDPVGFFLLALLGTAALTAAAVGLRRGRSVSIVAPLRFYRADKPRQYWCQIAVQLAVGLTCVIAAIRAV